MAAFHVEDEAFETGFALLLDEIRKRRSIQHVAFADDPNDDQIRAASYGDVIFRCAGLMLGAVRLAGMI